MGKRLVAKIITLLTGAYGEPVWTPDGRPVSTLVQTVLSQHTSDINSGRAFEALIKLFPRWDEVLDADAATIAAAIKPGGLADIKSRRIKQILEEIRRRRGSLELDFLKGLPLEEAREWLKALPGVGDKTAACVLLFSLGMPDLPVDTHVYRVAKRLALIGEKASFARAHRDLLELTPKHATYAFHVLMIEHGRKTCKAHGPRCQTCVLGDLCPSRDVFLSRL